MTATPGPVPRRCQALPGSMETAHARALRGSGAACRDFKMLMAILRREQGPVVQSAWRGLGPEDVQIWLQGT